MVEKVFGSSEAGFVDRRSRVSDSRIDGSQREERRQFSPSYEDLSEAAQELGQAVDQYKLVNRRRYINYEELLSVIMSIGYKK